MLVVVEGEVRRGGEGAGGRRVGGGGGRRWRGGGREWGRSKVVVRVRVWRVEEGVHIERGWWWWWLLIGSSHHQIELN